MQQEINSSLIFMKQVSRTTVFFRQLITHWQLITPYISHAFEIYKHPVIVGFTWFDYLPFRKQESFSFLSCNSLSAIKVWAKSNFRPLPILFFHIYGQELLNFPALCFLQKEKTRSSMVVQLKLIWKLCECWMNLPVSQKFQID